MLRRGKPTPERRMLARAAAVLAARIAAGFLVALALLGFGTYRVVLAEQHTQAEQQLNYALAYGNPAAATPCLWLFVVDKGNVQHPQQSPAGFPLASAVADARVGTTPQQTSVTISGTQYDVVTERQGGVVRQAVLDTWYLQADLDHLVRALLLVGLIGVGAAAILAAELARRSIAPLADAYARQRRFVADASHELRTPLTRLHTRAQLLLRWKHDQLPERLTEELHTLVRSACELNDVVEDLLISAGLRSDPDRRQEVDLAALAAEVIEAECPRLGSRVIVMDATGDPGLAPPGAVQEAAAISARESPTTVRGAESPLRRMVATLIDNAISHTEPTGRIEVTVRHSERGIIELEISDDGTGFDPVDRERIFERFAQSGHQGSHRFGLGLALAREIAADHGGTIHAVGRPGEGATFTVRLPAA
ncbi:HAMP domain-containing sensor histidine kinase [Actinospica sp.]|uniref:sensor histidine kinase n=1 Tax=Actinospica sp. TaxID=1872142 RepID=UPI002CAE0E13|nr:HAMP domain-containing sensor histidine kinase [Actinospica sp.]HWG22603.1 HAMP domain-containing sensor histidine kinase [Actinospica sp.]